MNRIQMVENWLFQLQLAPLNAQEAIFLAQPPEKSEICDIFDDLLLICEKRFAYASFWPDFHILGLSCPIADKPRPLRKRIFAIGIHHHDFSSGSLGP